MGGWGVRKEAGARLARKKKHSHTNQNSNRNNHRTFSPPNQPKTTTTTTTPTPQTANHKRRPTPSHQRTRTIDNTTKTKPNQTEPNPTQPDQPNPTQPKTNPQQAFQRADQIAHAQGRSDTHWFAPIVADAEAGFGGSLNAYELMRALIKVRSLTV